MTGSGPDLHLPTMHETPYGWPLRQLGVPQAHEITRGSPDVVVAVLDLGYRPHPHHEGHLWVNPRPTRGDVHGWDWHDDDASLEHSGPEPDSAYFHNHHAFIVGQVIACAPECPVMIVRVGYGNPGSWWRGVDWAVEHGAKVLVMPHGFISHGEGAPHPLFYMGTDFGYPVDNPELRRAMEDAWDAGCLILQGTADNRGRRVAALTSALSAVIAVGSANRQGEAADIATSSDYVEVAAPGGQRSADEMEHVWSTGGRSRPHGEGDYVASTGGCMAAGFGGGVAALVCSRFLDLTNAELRQVLRNTASNDVWDPGLGWGVIDAHAAVSLERDRLCQDLAIDAGRCTIDRSADAPTLLVRLANRGAFDIEQALVVAYDGNPLQPAASQATLDSPVTLETRQLGHVIAPVRGLHGATVGIALSGVPDELWVQACTLDHRGDPGAPTARVCRRG